MLGDLQPLPSYIVVTLSPSEAVLLLRAHDHTSVLAHCCGIIHSSFASFIFEFHTSISKGGRPMCNLRSVDAIDCVSVE